MSHQITRMQQRGLVSREECDDDARGVWVILTSDGTDAVLAAQHDRGAAISEHFFDALDDDEKRAIHSLSHKVLATINPPLCTERNVDA